MLRHEGVMDEALNEEIDRQEVIEGEVEDVLAILFQEGGETVPFLSEFATVLVLDSFDCKRSHSVNINKYIR